MISFFHTKNNKKGFTLVEMLVATAVFMSVMMVAITALVSIINANRREEQIKNVIDNVTFSVDSIARNIRVGSDYRCWSGGVFTNGDAACAASSNKILYRDANDSYYTEYLFASSSTLTAGEGNIQRVLGCDSSGTCTGTPLSMTAPTSTVNITGMVFYVLGTGTGSGTMDTYRQPRVIITVEGDIISQSGTPAVFTMQTTASERIRQVGN